MRAAAPKKNSDPIGLGGVTEPWPNPATGKENGSMIDLVT